MMTSETKDSAVLFYYEWEESFEELSDSEYRQMIQAIQKYAKSGELPKFEDRTMRSVFKLVRKAIDRNTERYDKKCQKNKENGKLGGAPKGNQNAKRKTTETTQNNRTVKKTTETTLPEREREPERDRGREYKPVVSPPADTTTTTAPDLDEIMTVWNCQPVTRPIIKIGDSGKRHDRTEMAVAVAGGHGAFLNAIRSLKNQAYFQNRQKDGYKVEYDWFVDPENFQNVLEGKYAKSRDKFGDGWEVVDFG